jgi:hypothetical protein
MNYDFKDSATEPVSQTMLLGLAGPSGGGKTESAIRIARGIAGDNVAVIDTENRRALNKKGRYKFRHLDLQPPYSPATFHDAIAAAIKTGFRAIIVDSFSAEWDGEGGLQDQSTEILERLCKGDMSRAERLTALAWKDPKQVHKRLMTYLRRLEVPIIFCLRAEPKIKFIKDEKGKTQVVDAGWLPITEKLFAYDMLIYALMMPDNPGVPVHLKKLEPEFEPMFPVGEQITEHAGRLLVEWATGRKDTPKPAAPVATSPVDSARAVSPPAAADPTDAELVADITVWVKRHKFETAYDVARAIKDEGVREDTIARIAKAKDYVMAKEPQQ